VKALRQRAVWMFAGVLVVLAIGFGPGNRVWAVRPDLPVPSHYVEDRAGVIEPAAEQRINGLLQELEQKTGAQFVVLTVDTVKPLTIEQFSIALAEKWQLGQAKEDNGLLLTVAVQDRRARIEVGYGLEGFLTDQFCGRIIREVMAPRFRQGRFGEGIHQAVLILASRTAEQAGVRLTGLPEPVRLPPRARGVPCFIRAFSTLFPILLFALILLTRGGSGGLLWFLLGMSMGSRGGYYGHRGGFGGGFGGGGFGGFGGGGGGGFGGGGASGGW